MDPDAVTARLADLGRVGSLPKDDPTVGTGFVKAATEGDRIRIQIRVSPPTETIGDVRFRAFGCGASIAAASLVAERVEGLALGMAASLPATEIAATLGLKSDRLYSAELAVRALRDAVADYNRKRGGVQ